MRAPHWIAVTIVALCAGLCAGYLLFRNDPPPRIATAPHTQEPADTRPDEKPSEKFTKPVEDEAGEPPAPRKELAPLRVAAAPDDSGLIAALKAALFEYPPGVNGVISGYVKDPDGKPVPGVQMTLTPRLTPAKLRAGRFASADDPDLWAYLAAEARANVAKVAGPYLLRQTTSTNEDGYYEFADLWDLSCTVLAEHAGYAISPKTSPANLRPGESADWLAWQSARVEVTVELPFEIKFPALSVVYVSEGGKQQSMGAKPGVPVRLTLESGKYTMWAEEVSQSLKSEMIEIEPKVGAELLKITLRPTEPPRIVVELEYPAGRPQQYVTANYAEAKSGVAALDHFGPHPDYQRAMIGVRGSDQFKSNELEPGKYVVGVFLYNKLMAAEFVEVTRPPTVAKLVVPGPEGGVGIVCELSVPKGTSDEEPEFEVWWSTETLRHEGGRGGQTVWNLGDNKYRVVAAHAAKDATPARVTAKVRGLGSLSHSITRVNGENLTFDFQAPATVKLSISGVTEDLRKVLRASCGSGGTVLQFSAAHSATAVIKGKIVLQMPPVQPGTLSIALQTLEGGPAVFATSVYVGASDEKEVELEIPELFDLTVNADENNRWGELLWESGAPNARLSLRFDGLGKCVVRYLPAGTYTLRYRVEGAVRERKVAVASDTTVHLRD